MLSGGVHWMCVDCELSGSPHNAGGERYAHLRLEFAAEWHRLGVEALRLEHFVKKWKLLFVFRLLSFEYHQRCTKGFRGLKCSVKCVECRGQSTSFHLSSRIKDLNCFFSPSIKYNS